MAAAGDAVTATTSSVATTASSERAAPLGPEDVFMA
jgi:hypothetical protein